MRGSHRPTLVQTVMGIQPIRKGELGGKFPAFAAMLALTARPPTVRLQMKMVCMQSVIVGRKRGAKPFARPIAGCPQKICPCVTRIPVASQYRIRSVQKPKPRAHLTTIVTANMIDVGQRCSQRRRGRPETMPLPHRQPQCNRAAGLDRAHHRADIALRGYGQG